MSYENVQRRTRLLATLLVCVILLLALQGCGTLRPGDDWSTDNTVSEVAFQAANVLDAYQTAKIADRPDLREGNAMARVFLGSEPNSRDVALYFGSLAVSHYLISRALPAKWRPWWQNTTAVAHGAIVLNNCAEHSLC